MDIRASSNAVVSTGDKYASVGVDKSIRLSDAKTGSLIQVLGPVPAEGAIRKAVFRPDGKQIASIGSDG